MSLSVFVTTVTTFEYRTLSSRLACPTIASPGTFPGTPPGRLLYMSVFYSGYSGYSGYSQGGLSRGNAPNCLILLDFSSLFLWKILNKKWLHKWLHGWLHGRLHEQSGYTPERRGGREGALHAVVVFSAAIGGAVPSGVFTSTRRRAIL